MGGDVGKEVYSAIKICSLQIRRKRDDAIVILQLETTPMLYLDDK